MENSIEKSGNKEIMISDKEKKAAYSPLIIVTALLFLAAAVVSVFSMINIIDLDLRVSLLEKWVDDGILERDSLIMWMVVYVVIRAMFSIFAFTFAAGLGVFAVSSFFCKKSGQSAGLSIVSEVTRGVKYLWYGVCAILAVVFVYRFVIYIIANLNANAGVMFIFSMLFFELVCLALFILLSVGMVKVWKEIIELCDSLKFIFLTGKIGYISPAPSVLMLVVALASVIAAVINIGDTVAIVTFVICAVACVLFSIWIKRLKSRIEWIRYTETKRIKDSEKENRK